MIRCLFMHRKLYEYVDEALTEEENVRVANHLEICPRCRAETAQIRELLVTAAHAAPPAPSEDFWKGFQAELDDRLNRKLVPDCRLRTGAFRFFLLGRGPVLALATACIAVIAFSFSLRMAAKPVRLAKAETELVEEIGAIEKLNPELIPVEELEGMDSFAPL
jgi:anti-sigma factor RsiW